MKKLAVLLDRGGEKVNGLFTTSTREPVAARHGAADSKAQRVDRKQVTENPHSWAF